MAGEQTKPVRPRMWVVLTLLGVTIAGCVATFGTVLDLLSLVDRSAEGERITYAEAVEVDDSLDGSFNVQLGLLVLTAIAWVLWQSRAYRNALALGIEDRRFPPRDAVLWWFIPIANLWKPKQAMNDLWRGSDPDLRGDETLFRHRPHDPLLDLWWAAWLSSGLILWLHRNSEVTTPEEARNIIKVALISDILSILAAALAMVIIVRITQRLEEREQRLRAGGGAYLHGQQAHDQAAARQPGAAGEPAAVGVRPGGSVPPPGYR